MAIPTGYTEDELAQYMHETLGADDVARQLDWTPEEGHYDEAVFETLMAYGTDDIESITGLQNIRRLRAIARRELWRLVMQRTVHQRDTNTEGGNDAHSQVHRHAREMFKMADKDVEPAFTAAPPGSGPLTNKYRPWGS
ncbi:MAG: hypothetical protein ACOC8X_03555 [Chloroflexota bacterium]